MPGNTDKFFTSPRQKGRNWVSNLRPAALARRLAALPRDDSGVALVFIIAVFLFLFVLVLSVFSISEAIRQKEEVQNACDAAAHAGAVAQADDLSRIAVLNRALSWNYVQMTKLQMDYITYSWLRVTCDKFAEDRQKCIGKDNPGLWDLIDPSNKWRYYFIPDLLDKIRLGFLKKEKWVFPYWKTTTIPIGWGIRITVAREWLVFNCYHNTHNKADNRISNYIGMRDGNQSKYEEIRINGYSDLDDRCLRFRQCNRSGAPYGGDLDLVDGGQVVQKSVLAEIENLYGGYGCPKLAEQINGCKGRAAVYAALIGDVNKKMKDHITAAVRETLLQNLPRSGDDDPDDDTLSEYYWFCTGGTSIAPREYETADETAGGEKKAYASYWSGLSNTEQDEMLFLNMADGLPEDAKVTLADYFKDRYTNPLEGGGLDQWFIRCRPEESQSSNEVCVVRDWVHPTPGIIRCYKNANYHDARSLGIIPNVHRGNYIFDGMENFIEKVKNAIADAVASVFSVVPIIGDYIGDAVKRPVANAVGEIIAGLSVSLEGNMVVPSCENSRERYPDMCAEIADSTREKECEWGLVAEYKWAAAYWLCAYVRKGTAITGGIMVDLPVAKVISKGAVLKCFHVPFAIGALYGGATNNGYRPGGALGFKDDIAKNFPGGDDRDANGQRTGQSKGHSRNDYRTEAIFVDGEPFKRGNGCGLEILPNGLGSNMILKSYVRVYGDDKDAYDENYCGALSMPWVLNENFFNGLGTIIVGLAKKRRNVFDVIVGNDIPEKSLHAAFSPPDGSHVVALAAARAAYAPRHGDRSADGEDTVNDNGGTRYDIHYDAVCKNLKPKLIRGDSPEAEWERKASDLEEKLGLGCVCTDDSGNSPSPEKMAQTANRLRRQWNLCQTDWDGVLLPVRFTRAAIKEHNSNPTGQKAVKADEDTSPEWVESKKNFEEDDSIWELVQLLMSELADSEEDTLGWRSFKGDGKASLRDLLDRQAPSDEESFTDAVRKRRVL